MRILILIFALFFIGCEDKKVPVVLGFDSDYSSIAKELKNGILLAEDETNVKFEFIDNKGNKFITSQIDKDLINKNTPIVIGHITSSITKVAVPLFNQSNTILFSPTASTKDLSNLDDNFIRIQPTKNFESIKEILIYLSSLSKYNKMNIIYDIDNASYAKSLISSINDKRNKYIRVENIIPVTEIEFSSNQIKNLDKNEPIFIIASSKFASNIVKTLKNNKFKGLILVSGSAFTKDFIKLSGKDGEGVLFFSTFNPHSDDKKYLKFKDKFIAKFGYTPGNFDVKGYEIAKITSEIINKSDIKKALVNHIFEGLQGKIYINKYGDTIRESHIFILNNGIFEKVK